VPDSRPALPRQLSHDCCEFRWADTNTIFETSCSVHCFDGVDVFYDFYHSRSPSIFHLGDGCRCGRVRSPYLCILLPRTMHYIRDMWSFLSIPKLRHHVLCSNTCPACFRYRIWHLLLDNTIRSSRQADDASTLAQVPRHGQFLQKFLRAYSHDTVFDPRTLHSNLVDSNPRLVQLSSLYPRANGRGWRCGEGVWVRLLVNGDLLRELTDVNVFFRDWTDDQNKHKNHKRDVHSDGKSRWVWRGVVFWWVNDLRRKNSPRLHLHMHFNQW